MDFSSPSRHRSNLGEGGPNGAIAPPILLKLRIGFLVTDLKRGKFKKKIACLLNSCMGVDKKNQLDVTFCILYFSSNSCSTCFGQPCAHHQQLTTA